jgi:hypothetical protein
MKIFLIVGIILGLCFVSFILEYNDWVTYRFFTKRKEVVESKSYKPELEQKLRDFQVIYMEVDKKRKKALVPIILNQVAGVNLNELPSDIQDFIVEVKQMEVK